MISDNIQIKLETKFKTVSKGIKTYDILVIYVNHKFFTAYCGENHSKTPNTYHLLQDGKLVCYTEDQFLRVLDLLVFV